MLEVCTLSLPKRSLGPALVGLGLAWWLVSAAGAEMVFSGYTQARFNLFDQGLDKPSGFDLARVRLKYAGTINDRGTLATLQVDLAKLDDRQDDKDPRNRRVTLTDAWVQHPFGQEWSARMGYAIVPFGFEEEYSNAKSLTFDRTKAATSFFPGERETGLYLFYRPQSKNSPEVAVGYSSGMDRWGDKDPKTGDQDQEARAWTARVQWRLPRAGAAGVSYTAARRERKVGEVRRDFDQNCFGVHLRYNGAKGLSLQTEYYAGEILSARSKGWYGQVEYTATTLKPFYRYDVFDDGVAGHQTYRRHTVGEALEPDRSERFTLQVERYEDLKGGTFTNYGVQYQFVYGGK